MFQLRHESPFQDHECFNLPRGQLVELRSSQPPARQKLVYQCLRFRCDMGFGTFGQHHVPPGPNRPPRWLILQRQPPAPPSFFQAGFPARIALPTGLVRKVKMEGDNQFFLSGSLSPASPLTAARASRNRFSGPALANSSGVASSPSTVRPLTSCKPHIT